MTIPLICPKDTPVEVAAAAAFKMFAAMMSSPAAADGPALLMLSESWCTWQRARADVAREGITVMSGGCAISHPALFTASKAQAEVVVLLRELKLTPASRQKGRPKKKPKPEPDWYTRMTADWNRIKGTPAQPTETES